MVLGEWLAAAMPNIDELIQAERIRALYRLTPQSLVGGIVFACVLAWAVAGTAGWPLALAWLGVKLAVQGWRSWDWWLWARLGDAGMPNVCAWYRRHAWGSGTDGITWGAASVLFIPSGQVQLDGMLIASLLGVASVGVFTLSSLSGSAMRFMLGTLVPVTLQLFLQGHTPAVLMGVGVVIYLAVIYAECIKAENRQIELLRLRFENAAIAEQYQQAVQLAEHSNATKSRFLATVSHELRTPLNGILGMTELMSADTLSPPQRERLLVIRQSAQYLQTLIGDVLDISRIEFGRLELVPQDVDVARLVQEVQVLLTPIAAERGLALSVQLAPDLPSAARLDPVRVKQVLHNLLGNAIKFTPRGWVSLTVGEELNTQGRWLTFAVQDSGQGIAPQELARIFNAFEQGSASNDARRAGTGLGLTISRQLAQAMGGDVLCHSPPGQGATFTFSLRWQAPLGRPPATTPWC
jgi:signal transduction histidine kinase